MGLAASQARLLTITARKADCEFESMALSHQKLALARDMERVSTEYQNSLTKTKLVYDYYGSSDKLTDLTYGLFMEPSIYNDYVPKFVTDPKNRIILNSKYAAAAKAAGIPPEGLDGLPSSDVRDKFIMALEEQGIITPNKAASILAVDYNNAVGLGNGVTATTSMEELTFNEFIDALSANTLINQMGSNVDLDILFDGKDCALHLDSNLQGLSNPYRAGSTNSQKGNSVEYGPDNPSTASGYLSTVKLSDLLTGDTQYYISAQSAKAEMTPVTVIAALQQDLVGTGDKSPSFLNWLVTAFDSVLGGIPSNDTAIQYAYNTVYDLLYPNNKLRTWINENTENMTQSQKDNNHKRKMARCEWFDNRREDGTIAKVLAGVATVAPGRGGKKGQLQYGGNDSEDYDIDKSKITCDYMGTVYTMETDPGLSWDDRNNRSQAAINLNNLAKAFLTAYVQFQEGVEDSDYEIHVGKMEECNLYTPQRDKDFRFIVSGETEYEIDGDSKLYAQFYDTMFNRICLNGWTENDQIDDKDYMQELLKGGLAFVSSMSDDGFYYQGNYAVDRTILEVADTEAIAQAQAKYNREKAHIEYKEDRLDMKMKNLDTEISSLTTEYDTTKQIITKSVEKSFKRYEA